MHQDFALFATFTMALVTAFIGGYIARRLGLPTMVGYLLAGLAIGPFTPGFVGDTGAVSQLAEMGVIFMLFGVGLHFSLKDLWNVRSIAIPGAVMQTLTATVVGFLVTQSWGWSVDASLVLGLAISVASTVVLLRGLEDNGLLNTTHGKVAVGWLVFEDIATVAILVLLPAMSNGSTNPLEGIVVAILKTVIFAAIMLFAGTRFLSWLLKRIARTRSRELFILAVVTVALGTAFGAAELFGVSLALGAFLAGVVVGESEVHHQVGAEILPFREIFSVIFFVSVGMLVNPAQIVANLGQVLEVTALIILGKGFITILLSFILPARLRTMAVVAVGLAQIGEFSFIVGQTGVSLGLLSQEQYGLILAGSVISIVINPMLFHALPALERFLHRISLMEQRDQKRAPVPELIQEGISDHVVIVGYGRVGAYVGNMLKLLNMPSLVIERDADRAENFQRDGMSILFGNAADSELLVHAHLERARALVVTVPDEITTELVVIAAHHLAPKLPIIVRASTIEGIERLAKHGANYIIHPELEGGLEMVRHTLLVLGFPTLQIQQYMDEVRADAYDIDRITVAEQRVLDQLLRTVRGMEITWHMITPNSPLVGQTLAEANLRAKVGASVIALVRDSHVMANPKSNTVFEAGDIVGLIGDDQELEAAVQFLDPVTA
jgi:CPA2 family monovalent cation:H+ antiporter-2